MGNIQAARELLGEAAESINRLIEKAVAELKYDEVKELADLADGLAKLLRGEAMPEAPRNTVGTIDRQSPPSAPPIPNRPKQPSSKKSQYPWFGRNADRLVKVGWSKKNKKEYEHRVPREAAMAFVHHLADHVTNGTVFDVEGLLPVVDASGEEIPAYQIYVTLAWLRDMNVIEKKGRDGYVLSDKEQLRGEVDGLWNSLRTRES